MVKNQIRKLIPARMLTGRPLLEEGNRPADGEVKTGGQAGSEVAEDTLECEEPVAVNPVRERFDRHHTPPPGYTFQPGRRT